MQKYDIHQQQSIAARHPLVIWRGMCILKGSEKKLILSTADVKNQWSLGGGRLEDIAEEQEENKVSVNVVLHRRCLAAPRQTTRSTHWLPLQCTVRTVPPLSCTLAQQLACRHRKARCKRDQLAMQWCSVFWRFPQSFLPPPNPSLVPSLNKERSKEDQRQYQTYQYKEHGHSCEVRDKGTQLLFSHAK